MSDTEDAIERCLLGFGYSVRRQSFRTSSRRLFAGSLLGAGSGWVALALAPLMILDVPGWMVAVIGVSALGAVSLISSGIATGALPFDVPSVDASNILATRGEHPVVWLVAHSDSKAQWLSLRGRVFATIALAVGLILTVLLLLFRLTGPLPWWVATPPLFVLMGGGAWLSRSPLHGESPGAVDNGSGVVAALRAAELLRDRSDVGVLVTGAEEFGMEGARAWVSGEAPSAAIFVNFDGIDARGQFNVMAHHAKVLQGVPCDATTLHAALCRGLEQRDNRVRKRPLPFGVFVDGSILAKGGLPGVTLSRGTWETLSVVHTPRDTIERTDWSGALEAGTGTAEVLPSLLG